MSTTNLFAAAAAAATTATATSKTKVKKALQIEGEFVREYNAAKATRKDAEAAELLNSDTIKTKAAAFFAEEYATQRKRPDLFNVIDSTGASVLYIPQGKFTTITEEKAAILSQFSPDLLEEKIEFGLNPAILEKYNEALSAAIMGVVPQEEWSQIFTTKKRYSVKEGAFDALLSYVQAKDLPQALALLQPITLLK